MLIKSFRPKWLDAAAAAAAAAADLFVVMYFSLLSAFGSLSSRLSRIREGRLNYRPAPPIESHRPISGAVTFDFRFSLSLSLSLSRESWFPPGLLPRRHPTHHPPGHPATEICLIQSGVGRKSADDVIEASREPQRAIQPPNRESPNVT